MSRQKRTARMKAALEARGRNTPAERFVRRAWIVGMVLVPFLAGFLLPSEQAIPTVFIAWLLLPFVGYLVECTIKGTRAGEPWWRAPLGFFRGWRQSDWRQKQILRDRRDGRDT